MYKDIKLNEIIKYCNEPEYFCVDLHTFFTGIHLVLSEKKFYALFCVLIANNGLDYLTKNKLIELHKDITGEEDF